MVLCTVGIFQAEKSDWFKNILSCEVARDRLEPGARQPWWGCNPLNIINPEYSHWFVFRVLANTMLFLTVTIVPEFVLLSEWNFTSSLVKKPSTTAIPRPASPSAMASNLKRSFSIHPQNVRSCCYFFAAHEIQKRKIFPFITDSASRFISVCCAAKGARSLQRCKKQLSLDLIGGKTHFEGDFYLQP